MSHDSLISGFGATGHMAFYSHFFPFYTSPFEIHHIIIVYGSYTFVVGSETIELQSLLKSNDVLDVPRLSK